MHFAPGLPRDAEEISELIAHLSGPFFVAPDRIGAEPFKASISVDAVRGYLQATKFSYLLARDAAGTLAGVVAIRDRTHLFHLFVADAFQGTGLARRLWEQARALAMAEETVPAFTVNSSLNAIPVYERFGFERQGEVKVMHGVSFQPMTCRVGDEVGN